MSGTNGHNGHSGDGHNGRESRLRLADIVRRAPTSAGRSDGPTRPALSRSQRVSFWLLAVLFASTTIFVLDYGAPPLAFRQGERATANILARVDFSYEDPSAYNQLRKDALANTPNVYTQDPGWATQLQADVDGLIEAKARAKDVDEFRKRVAELKIADGAKAEALYKSLDGFGHIREELLQPIATELARLQSIGVLKEERLRAESGRQIEIRLRSKPDRPGGAPVDVAHCYTERGAAESIEKSLGILLRGREPVLQETLRGLLVAQIQPSLTYDQGLSAAAQKQAEAAVDSSVAEFKRKKGEMLLRVGNMIGDSEIRMLRAENEACWAASTIRQRMLRTGGLCLLVALLFAVAVSWIRRTEPGVMRRARQLIVLGIIGLGVLVAARVAAEHYWPVQALPAVFFAMAAAMFFSARSAAALSLMVCILATVAGGGGVYGAVALAAGAVAGGLSGARPRHNLDVLRAALIAGLVTAVAAATGQLLSGAAEWRPVLREAGWGLGSALAQGLLLAGALPVLEPLFGVSTSLSLRVLCDPDQSPVLKTLFLNAPGTYQHCAVVGMLSESAAASVGADPLLARAGGYYHDVGKIARPEYFVENAPPGSNRHDRLTPAMSAMVVTAHVRDGAELARAFRLPRPLVDIIEQHHGTTLAEFFYRRALERGEPTAESVFRYPGPRPQTKEAAIVLVADAVEAASRTLESPSAARIEAMVREISRRRLLEGQFDDCGLTLRELSTIEATFTRILMSMFHTRVAYPEARSAARTDDARNVSTRS